MLIVSLRQERQKAQTRRLSDNAAQRAATKYHVAKRKRFLPFASPASLAKLGLSHRGLLNALPPSYLALWLRETRGISPIGEKTRLQLYFHLLVACVAVGSYRPVRNWYSRYRCTTIKNTAGYTRRPPHKVCETGQLYERTHKPTTSVQ